jgi:hypothetical protein
MNCVYKKSNTIKIGESNTRNVQRITFHRAVIYVFLRYIISYLIAVPVPVPELVDVVAVSSFTAAAAANAAAALFFSLLICINSRCVSKFISRSL